MKIAPLIHSRTLYCDFNSNFAVRPQNLNVQWARDKIRAATKDLGIFNDVRRVVASKDGVGIAGVACIFKFFVEKYCPDKVQEFEKYFRDEVRREVKIFLGYTFEMSGKREFPNVTDEDLLQMFMDSLAPEWERKFVETVYSNYKECGTKNFSDDQKPFETISGVEIYNVDVFNKFLADAQIKNISYCSNVNQFDIWQEGKFSAIFTSDNSVISGLKSQPQKKTSTPQVTNQQVTRQQVTRQQVTNQQSPKNQNPPPPNSNRLMIFATALIVLMAIIFLLMR
ncbi:MAG: hypothetical protein IJS81_11985 [Selenomonadaceae bacterium]|nr:hypothetical protein [Selenomonadaceae bacterium]